MFAAVAGGELGIADDLQPPPHWPEFVSLLGIDVFKEEFVDVGSTKPLGQVVDSRKIYVRECYKDLAPKMQELLENEDNEAVIVTGSPGVGKSLFGILFLVNVVKAMRDRTTKGRLESITNVLYEQARSTGGSSHYLVNVASAKIVMIPNQKAWQYQTSEQTFVIKDGACIDNHVVGPMLWVSSPRKDSISQLQKKRSVETRVVPPMEGAELVDCVAKKCYPPNLFKIAADDAFSKDAHKAMVEATMEIESEVGEGDVEYEATKQAAIIMRWAADLGPYTRRVFNPEKGYGEVNNALFELNSLSFSLIANIAINETTSGSNFEHSHRLVAVSTCADYKSTNLTPASKAIARKIIDFERKDTMTHVLSLLGQVQGAREGLIFEPYAHHKLSIGGEWEMKKLTALGDVCDKLILPIDMKTVTISNEEILSEHSDDDHPACSQATYYRPESTSFPVVDGWKIYFQPKTSCLMEKSETIKELNVLTRTILNRKARKPSIPRW